MVPVAKGNYEGSKALELQDLQAFLVTDKKKILLMDDNFEVFDELPIELFKSDSREKTQVLAI
jgi:hypothetical protein